MKSRIRKPAAIIALCGAWLVLAGCEQEPTHQAEGLPTGESTPDRRDGLEAQRERAAAPETDAEAEQPALEPAEPPPAGDQPPPGVD